MALFKTNFLKHTLLQQNCLMNMMRAVSDIHYESSEAER